MSLITCKKSKGGGNSLKLRGKSEEVRVGGSSSSWGLGGLFSFILSIALLFGVNSAWAESISTTYYQAKNWEGPAELPHGQDGKDIGYTSQLAFSGITIDDIPVGATFYTTIYGTSITAQYKTSVGMHETRCDTDGDGRSDKMALQFAIHDGVKNQYHTKCVILVFTNVEGEGVHVQKFCQLHKANEWLPNTKFFEMDSSGKITKQNSPSSWDESATSYSASGLWTHGISLANMIDGTAEKKLVFRGTTLKQLKGSSFMAGYRFGRNLEKELAEANDEATFVTNWPSDDNIQKIVMQFRARGTDKRTAIIELTEENGNVYAKHVLSCYGGSDKTQYFNIDDDGTVFLVSDTCKDANNCAAYPVHDFYVQYHPCVPKAPNKIKVFSDPSKTLSLDDIQSGDFTTRMCGGWMHDSFRETHNTGYNKKVYKDEVSGSVTNIVVEFQVRDGLNTKCLVVSFTNGDDGIYAEAINARYSTELIGYQYRDYDGTLHGNQNDKSGEIVAEKLEADGYGAFDLRVKLLESELVLDQDNTWSELLNGAEIGSDSAVSIKVTEANATLTINENVNVSKIEFANGNGATLQINSDSTLTTGDISGIGKILNNGTVVKTGDGMVAWPFNNDSTGTNIVSSGTLKVVSKTGSGTGHTVRVKSGAVFDANGVVDVNANVILEEGAYFVNEGGNINYNNSQTVSITLEGDATATATGKFGLIGPLYDPTTLNLGANTLTLDGANTFWLCNTTINGEGVIAVNSGTLGLAKNASTGNDCTIRIGARGAISMDAPLTVKNFENGGEISGSNKKLTVTGCLTPGSAAIPRLILESGATIKATYGTKQTVSTEFKATGTNTVDASAITKEQLKASETGIAVLTVPLDANTAGNTWNVSGLAVRARATWVPDEGGKTKTLRLFRSTGLMVIIR